MAKLIEVCDFQGGSQPPKNEWIQMPKHDYIRMLQIRDFTQPNKNVPEYVKKTNKLKICSENDILIARYGASLGKILTGLSGAYNVAIMRTIPNEKVLTKRYLFYYLNSSYFQTNILNVGTRAAQSGVNKNNLSNLLINCPSINEQKRIAFILDSIKKIISFRKEQLEKFDKLIKARFVEMFGQLQFNPKKYKIMAFDEFAIFDTKMIHDFTHYQDYPHIGIENIEKNTGKLINYKTIKEDKILSGKYLFTAEHIIYSKIRPNLNKVALPNFMGLCSADSYPILVKKGICNRIFLAYVMRSNLFLDYVLKFSNRTNLPKVNKKQIKGFKCPIPPLPLQNEFANFVQQVDKSKFDNIVYLNKTLSIKILSQLGDVSHD